MSKRKLLKLVQEKHVSGWDDPRMPTLSGMRRRGYTPEAIRNFCAAIGVSSTNGIVELAMLEHFVREDLNKRAPRVMAVLHPLKVVIDNYPEGQAEEMDAVNNPEDPRRRHAQGPILARALHRAGRFPRRAAQEVLPSVSGQGGSPALWLFHHRKSVVKDEKGEVIEVHCTYDPATRGGNAPDGRKVKSTIHWVSAAHAVDAEVRLYDNLFTKEDPNRHRRGRGFHGEPESELARSGRRRQAGAIAGQCARGDRYQFERLGYFCVDPDSKPGKPVFNRTVALKDAWAKIEKEKSRALPALSHRPRPGYDAPTGPRLFARRPLARAGFLHRLSFLLKAEGRGNDDVGPIAGNIHVLWIAEGAIPSVTPFFLAQAVKSLSQAEQACQVCGGKSSMMDV